MEETYNLYEDTVKLSFKDGGNRWSVSFKLPDGQWSDPRPCQGHSSIKAIKNKPFLIPWAGKASAESFRDEVWKLVKEGKELTKGVLDELVNYAKQAPTRARDSGAERGSDVHKAIELYLQGKTVPELEGDALKRFGLFQNFWSAREYEMVSVERPVYSKILDFATKIDVIFKTPRGELIAGDFKTGKDIYVETFAQLGAGALCMYEETKELPKDLSAILITEDEVREKRVSEMGLDTIDAIHFWESHVSLARQSTLWENKFN